MKKHVLVVGNEFDSQDGSSLKLVALIEKQVPQIHFTAWDPTEELPSNAAMDLVLIDAVMGIKTPQVFNDLESFRKSPRSTVHDFDLPIALGILKKIRKITSITIIGVPLGNTSESVQKELISILKSS